MLPKKIVSILAASATIFSISLPAGLAYNDKAYKLQEQARDEVERKNFARAESLYLQAATEGEKNGYQYRTNAIEELAQFYLDRKDFAKAEKMLLKALTIGHKEWAPSKSFDYEYENCSALSRLYRSQKNYAKASAIMAQAVSHLSNPQDMRNDDRFSLASELLELSHWLMDNNKEKEAEALCFKALGILNSGEDVKYHQKQIDFCRHQLAKCLIATKKYQEADTLLSQVLAHRKTDFTILDWQIAGPSFDKLTALKNLNKKNEANVLASKLNKYWPQSAFTSCSQKEKQLWEDTIIGADKLNEMDYGDDSSVSRALDIAKRFGEKDIRFAVSNALLAKVKLRSDYQQVKPVSAIAIASIEKVLGLKNPATAAFLEHWGKSLENRTTITSAPFGMYTEALKIRLASTKSQDTEAFNGAWQIGNYCKTLFSRSSSDDVLAMYDEVCKILILAGGSKNTKTLNALDDQISMLEFKNRFTIKPQDKSKIESLYKRLMDLQSKAFGTSSDELQETKSNYSAFLKAHRTL